MTDMIDVTKASGQLSGLLSAVGLEAAWGAVQQAGPDQLGENERDAVLREIATMQLGKATDLVKTGGLSPEVVQLLQMLINLMAGQPGLAPGAEPGSAPAPDEAEMAAAPAPAPSAPAPQAPPAPQAKELPPALDESGTTAMKDDPQGLPDANAGKYGQTPAGDPSYDEAKALAQKDLPAPQRDAMPSAPQKDPQLTSPRSDNVRGGTGGGGREGGDANALPAAQSDAQPSSPQKDPQPGTPTRKAGDAEPVQKDARTGLPKHGKASGWWHQADIGRQDPDLLKRQSYRKA